MMQDIKNIWDMLNENPVKLIFCLMLVPMVAFGGAVIGFLLSAGFWAIAYYFINSLDFPAWLKVIEILIMLISGKIFVCTSTLISAFYFGYKMLDKIIED